MEKDTSLKKLFIYILISIGVACGVYFIRFSPSGNDSSEEEPYSMIPAGAVLVYENLSFTSPDTSVLAALENFHNLLVLDSPKEKFFELDSLFGVTRLREIISGEKSYAAMFPNGRHSCGYLFYTPASKFFSQDAFSFNDKKVKKRKYKGIQLSEITDSAGKSILSFIKINDWIVFGDSPALLEDAIRVYKGEAASFLKIRRQAGKHVISAKSGALIINYEVFPSYLASFAGDEGAEFLSGLGKLASYSVLDLTFREKEILLNGFTDLSDCSKFMSVFDEQRPVAPEFVNYISNQTAAVCFYGFSDGGRFMNALYKYWADNDVIRIPRWDSVSLNNNLEGLYTGLDGLAGIVFLEPADPARAEKMVYLKVKEPELYLKNLRSLAGDTVSNPEKFNGFNIYLLEQEEIPGLLFGSLMDDFGSCYATICGEFIVLAGNTGNLKKVISDIDTENVWGKTVKYNRLVEETLSGFNVFFCLNAPSSMNILKNFASDDMKVKLSETSIYQRNGLFSVQLSRAGDSYYTSLAIHLKDETTPQVPKTLVKSEEKLQVEKGLLAGPFKFSDGLAWQDSSGVFSYRSTETTISTDSLPEIKMLISADLDIDKEDEFIFVAGTQLFSMNRNLKVIEGFPVEFPDKVQLSTVSLLDYDNSKNYRICVSDVAGNVTLLDKKGKILEPWNPASFDYKLACPVKHVRIKGKDMIIILTENGRLHVTNRRAEPYPGFPVDLKATIKNPFYLSEGTNFNSTYLIVLTGKGELINIDMTGKVRKKNQLIRLSPDSKFQLCPDINGKGYLIVRQTRGRLDFLDQQGKLMTDLQGFSGYDLDVKYLNAGSSREAVIVSDTGNDRLYVFSPSGKNLTHGLILNSRNLQKGSVLIDSEIIFYKEYNGVIEGVTILKAPWN